MIGILCIEISKNEKRQKCIQHEAFCGVLFCVARIKVKNPDGILDKFFIMSAMRALKKEGVYRVATPEHPYIKGLLERYNMTEVTHLPLMRALAGRLLLYLTEKTEKDVSVAVYARKIDADVMNCVRTACDRFKMIQLDLGTMTETVRRQMMDEYGSSPVIGELSEDENPKIRVLFDRPPYDAVRCESKTTILNLSGRPIEDTDYYNDIEADFSDIGLPIGTDSIGVFTEIVKNNSEMVSSVRIVSLVKKT